MVSGELQAEKWSIVTMIISFKSMHLFFMALALCHVQNVYAVTNNDFVALKWKLKEYIDKNPDRHIPLLVRNSFHDLFLNDKAALQGCIAKTDFLNDLENKGLDSTNKDLQDLIMKDFPKTNFSYGDVIAFAGKVAVESAYPCMKIPFRFNRSSCSRDEPNFNNRAPSSFADTIDKLGPMFDYLGGSITPRDLAILLAGGHGIKGARAGSTDWFGVFSTFSSGKEFIAKTFREAWRFIGLPETLDQFFTGEIFNRETSIIRLPSDLMFYPSKVPDGSNKDKSQEAATIEAQLLGFIAQDRSVFDKEFEIAYGKLLAIGDASQAFIDDCSVQVCPDIINQHSGTILPPPPTTTNILSSTTIASSYVNTLSTVTSILSSTVSSTTILSPTATHATNEEPYTTTDGASRFRSIMDSASALLNRIRKVVSRIRSK